MTDQEASNSEARPEPPKPGRLRVGARWMAIFIGGLFAVPILVTLLYVAFGIPIELDWLKGKIETGAAEALGRGVAIEGPLTLVPSIPPAAQIESVRVGNPQDWPAGDLARLELARAQLRILPLLRGEVLIDELKVDGLQLNLETDAEGNRNWLLTNGDPEPEDEQADEREPKALKFIELARLSLSDIRILRRDLASGKELELIVDEIQGRAPDREPMHLRVTGTAQEVPYELELNAGSLADLVEGTEPWSLDLTAVAAGARLGLHGTVAKPLQGKGIALDFELTGPNMTNLEILLGTRLPPIRSFELGGHIAEKAGKYRILDLAGEVAATGLTGSFEADLSQGRPLLNGNIDIKTIDAGPFFSAIGEKEKARSAESEQAQGAEDGVPQDDDKEPQGSEIAGKVDIDEPVLTLDPLTKLDARFNLTIHEVVNSPTSLRDATLEIRVEDGALTAPVSVTLAEVPFNGELKLAAESGMPKISVRLGAEQSRIGELARFLVGSEGIEGEFNAAELAFSAIGESIRGLIQTSELRFDMTAGALSYGHNEAGGKAVGFTLDETHMTFPAADESTINAAGSLLGVPFTLEASGGTFIENFIDRRWPVKMTAAGGGARFDLEGTVRRRDVDSGSELAFSLTGEPIGDLSVWVGVSPDAAQPYELSGKVTHDLQGLRIQIDQASVGSSSFAGEVGVRRENDTSVTFARLDFQVLDLAGLAALAPEPKEKTERKQGKATLAIDVPILPKGIELFDSDVAIAIARIKLESIDVSKITFSSRIADGYLERAPIALAIAGSGFEGELGADLRGDIPKLDLQVRSSKVDVGTLFAQLGIATGVELTAGDFDLDLALSGSSVREVLARSRFSVGISDGHWEIDDPNTEGRLDIRVLEAKIESEPEEPIGLDIDGLIGRTSVKIGITTDSLASFAEPKDRLKMDLGVELANAQLSLTGTAPRPVDMKNLHFEMDLKGKRISDFDRLLDLSLPPVGPYRLQGKFGTQQSGYYVKELQANIGNSSLSGELDVNTSAKPPHLTLDLAARTIQLDDFTASGWSAETGTGGEAGESGDTEEREAEGGEAPAALLSPEVMRSLNANVGVKVQSVQSGADWLGSGELTATLEDGRLKVDPLTLDIPGGFVDLGFALQPEEREIVLEARADIQKLDYGILARRIDPKSETGGIISLDVDLKTRGPDLRRVMQGSNGHIDFAVAPEDLDAGIFDLWAVNLVSALMPSLDDDSESKVNCIVARFGIEDGIMRPTALLIDSSRIQASGDGVVDFKAETVELTAKPKSKRPQMFSAKTPVQVGGKFSDFEVGLPPGALVGTVVRMVSSPMVAPFQWVFTEKEPADGRIACRRAWEGRPAPEETEPEVRQDEVRPPDGEAGKANKPEARKNRRGDPSDDVLQPGGDY